MPRDPADGHDQGRRIGLTHKANNEPLGFPELEAQKAGTLSQNFRSSAQTWPKPHRSSIHSSPAENQAQPQKILAKA